MAKNPIVGGRKLDLDLVITPFGATGMLFAKSVQMPNLMVAGTDEANLWDCIQPVITGLFEANGERVQTMTVDRSAGPREIRVHVELAAAS